MRLHLELRLQKNIEAGMAPDEARRAAKLQFGNRLLLEEESHAAWGWEWIEQFLQDAAYGIRAMLRSPGITFVALLSLALGIGANTAIFSLIDALLLRSLPVKNPQELVIFGDGSNNGISDSFPDNTLYSYPFFREMQKRNEVFTDVAASSSLLNLAHGTVEGHSVPEPMHIKLVSGSYFPTLGVEAVIGRLLNQADDQVKDAHPVAVLNYVWCKRSFGSAPNVLGKKVTVGSTVFTVVGVAPPEFFGNEVGESPDMWIPLAMQKEIPPGHDGYADAMSESLHLIARLKPGVGMAEAGANVNVLFRQILKGLPNVPLTAENMKELENSSVDLHSFSLGFSRLRVKFSEPLKILMAVVALVLLIACGNIANLLLARSTARARELAMRQALGARRLRLIRQLLTESMVLAFAGGALGVGLAMMANRLLLRMISGGDPLPLKVPLDLRLLLFALAVTLATALLFGTAPALRATELPLTDSLKEGRVSAGLGSKHRLAKTLIISQVALSLVLLTGAGLFLRSFINLTRVDTGFNRDGVLLFQLDPASAGYRAGDARLNTIYQQIEDRVGTLPGVRGASFSLFTFDEGTWNNSIWVEGYMDGHQDRTVHHNVVGNGYFEAMGIPVLEGRTFESRDTASSQRVGVISESMARNLFPKGSPIGRHYGSHDPQNASTIEVIGVVKDVKVHGVDEELQYVDYLSRAQIDFFYLNDLEIRYSGSESAVLNAVRQSIQDADPHLAISSVKSLETQVAESMPNQRLIAQLSAFFGMLAVFLSSLGIYGLMSYVVTRRTNEIGIRMALGGKRSDMLWLVMREILLLLAIGVGIGIPATLASGRVISSMLFGLRGTDV
ncbi:MAG TPA: ABC transporter permease, partial [Candidatus Acidoferrum sp.]|nr:ABC transporter permease [Candidatus Acidoferrum sp.]